MAKNWDESDEEVAAAPVPAVVIPKKKWEGEDEEEEVADDWDASSEEEEKPKPAAVAPPKKKGTLKSKLAEKEALKAAQKGAVFDNADDEDDDDDDESVDYAEQRRIDKERELESDLHNATDLLGAAAIGGGANSELASLLAANPRSKEDFIQLSDKIISLILARHENKPSYPLFVEHHVRALAQPLRDVEVRKAASALTTLANEKQKEARDKSSGKKKTKAAAKPTLGSAKASGKFDTKVYDEALDDFGKDADDFM